MKRTVGMLEAIVLALQSAVALAACPPAATCALSDAVEQTGPSWALGAADAMDSIVAAGNLTGDMAVVAANLATLQTPEQLSAAAAKMVPVIVGQGVQQANLTLDELSSLVVLRMEANRDQRASGGSRDQTVWVRPFGTRAEQQRDGQYPQYDVDSNGVAIGYDIDVGRWNVGAAYAFSQPAVRTRSASIDQEMDIDSSLIGLYGYWSGDGGAYADVQAVVGRNNNDTKRRIAFAGINRTAIGEYDTTYGRLTGALGRVYRLAANLTLTPTATFGYTYARDQSYTESGAGDLDLVLDDNVSESVVFDVDARLAYALDAAIRLTAHLGGGYRTFTDDASLQGSFVGGGPDFETAGPSIEPYLIRAGVGAEYAATGRLDIQMDDEYDYRGKFRGNLLTATLRCRI